MKKLISPLLAFSFLLSCQKSNQTVATLKSIVGEDNSAKATDRAEFADILTKQTNKGLVLNCNGVKLSDGRFLTAAHCLLSHNGNDSIKLLSKKIVRNIRPLAGYDLAVGELIGGAAPSESIKLFSGTIPSNIQLEATWFDYKTGGWRVSRGEGAVEGAFIKHNLDTNPGSSGSALYTVDDLGQKLLVGIHVGFAKEANTNIGILVSKAFDRNFTSSSADVLKYAAEGQLPFAYVCNSSTGECYAASEPPIMICIPHDCPLGEDDVGDDDGGTGGGNNGGDGGDPDSGGPDSGGPDSGGPDSGGPDSGGPDSGGPDSGGPDSGGPDSGGPDSGGPDSGGPDGGEDGSDGGFPPIIVIPGGGPVEGGPSTGEGGVVAKDCFNCDRLSWELKNNDLFKPECETPGVAPNVKPMLKGVKVELTDGVPLPEFRFNPRDDKFTQSLKDFAEKLKEATKWKTTPELAEKMAKLSKEELERLQKWMEAVVKNLDDYYALLVATIKSDQLSAPEIPQVDVSKEGIEAAKRYLDAVKKQIAENPDQFLEARLSVADSSAKALGIASEALASGDRETAEAAMELGRGLADAALGWFPGVGFAKDLVEATTGYNYITKQELSRFEVVAAWVGVFSAGYGSKILTGTKAIKLVAVAARVARTSKLGLKLEQYGLRAKEIYDVAAKAGLKSGKNIGHVVDAVRRKLPNGTAAELEEELTKSFKRYENLPRVNGQRLRNGHYAGNNYYEELSAELKSKYPHGVDFKDTGFPDFSPYAQELKNGKKFVKIEPGATHNNDLLRADKAAGMSSSYRVKNKLTWHHNEEFGVMELVPRDIHGAVGHTGGFTIWGAGVKL